MKRILMILLISNFCCLTTYGQMKDIVQTDGMTSPLHKENIGKVVFIAGNILSQNRPIESFIETDFVKTFELKRASDLNIRVFMDNSITNYLHRLAPELTAEELIVKGNYQFSFLIDGKLIYQENLHHGAGLKKNTTTAFWIPFTSTKGEDFWGIYLWNRFMAKGGEKALTVGTHQLKVEIRPYLKMNENSEVKVGDLIAQGQLELVRKLEKISAKQMAIQPIAPNSDWEISKSDFDKKKIKELNKNIAAYTFKEITSIVVIKEGKLLLEEYFNGADRQTLHNTRSVGKSFASAMMGIAIKDGYIKNESQTLNTFYDLKKFSNYDIKKDSIKVKDLLSMSSAFEGSDQDDSSLGNEENMYPTENWVKFALDLPMNTVKSNGRQWDYFTAGVVLLGDIIHQSVPDGLEKYAHQKLFAPLNITKYQWQYTPQKVVNTAGGLQLTALDLAKFGQLYKNGGTWNGQQILPTAWVDKTFTKYLQVPERTNEFYGYLFWNKTYTINGKNYETFYCAGNGGSKIFVFKDLPFTIVITAKAYNRPYGHPQVDRMMEDFILPALLK